jgi:hypothetical protein
MVMMLCALAACAQRPTDDECKAAITHTMEVQIDEFDAPGSATSALRKELSAEQRQASAAFLKQQVPPC